MILIARIQPSVEGPRLQDIVEVHFETMQEPSLRIGAFKSFGNVVPSSQKFAKPSTPASKEDKASSGQDNDILSRPWAERFAPLSLDELAVHKKKVTDVQNWLSAVLQGRDRRVCEPYL